MDDWLNQVQEEAIEPDLEICDPHHHLWDHPDSRYLLDELLADLSGGHKVLGTVFVECSSMYRATGPAHLRPVGETEFVQGIAAMSASGNYGKTRVAAGIVSFADLCHPEVEAVLQAHMEASRNRFRGIRHAGGWDSSAAVRNSHTNPPEHLFANEAFRRGFALLARLDLSFDAWFYHPQFADFIDLARSFPDTRIVLDHFGGPLGIGPYAGRQEAVFAEWQKGIEALADCPNVFAKLGGINMKINGFGWHRLPAPPSSDELVARTERYYHWVIQQFGADRCMFESNFPVDRASCSYTVLWNAFKKISADYSRQERAALLHDTACRVYRIEREED